MPQIKLTDKTRRVINEHLKTLQELTEDAQTAIEAGIPGADEVLKRCNLCREGYTKMKAAYFPKKP